MFKSFLKKSLFNRSMGGHVFKNDEILDVFDDLPIIPGNLIMTLED